MAELIGSVLRTIVGLCQGQSMITAKTESEGTNKILRYLLMLMVVIIAINALVVWMGNK